MSEAHFPDKESRKKCWGQRDIYWECLDKHAPDYNKNNPKEKEPKECVQLRFEMSLFTSE
jgi:cytochrome c oxidase assembly factor 6